MERVWYYRDRLLAVATVTNTLLDPDFYLLPSEDLVDVVCPTCLNSTDGELHVDLGLLARELGGTDATINLSMLWELPDSWQKKCGVGSLTWIFNRVASMILHYAQLECPMYITQASCFGVLCSVVK